MRFALNAFVKDAQATVRENAIPLCLVLAITLLAKGGALFPGYSIDDYPFAAGELSGLFSDVMSKGRVGQWLFLKAAIALQLEPNTARLLFVTFSMTAYAALGLAIVRFWNVQGNGWVPVAAASMIANHPYTAEIFTFRIGLPLAAFVMALLALILFLIVRRRVWRVAGAAAFVLALSIYQIALHFALMIIIMGFAIEIANQCLTATDAVGSPFNGFWRSLLNGRSARLLLIVACGVSAYVTLGFVLRAVLVIDSGYFALVHLSQIPDRLRESFFVATATFLRPNPLIPSLARLSFMVVASLALGMLLRACWCYVPRWHGMLAWSGVAALLAVAVFWTIGLSLVLRTFWPVPRSMAHAGILWAGCTVIASMAASCMPLRRLLAAVALLIGLSFVGASEHVFDDQRRMNFRDAQLANRIVARLEQHQGFPAVRRVVIFGKAFAAYPAGPPRTMVGDMNISGFGASWSQVEVLREVTGYNLHRSSIPEEHDRAQTYCSSTLPWPAEEAISVQGELAIICLMPAL